jgi:hypothetical protein
MRILIAVALLITLSGCSTAGRIGLKDYDDVQSGPRAKIVFISPNLKFKSTSVYRLAIFVYDQNGDCSFTAKGKIPLSEGEDVKPIYVRANKRNYFAVLFENHEYSLLTGSVKESRKRLLFSFIPEDEREYTFEHIYQKGPLSMKYYMTDKNNNKIPIEVNSVNNGFYVDSEHTCKVDMTL